MGEMKVVVEQPTDWVATVLVPVVAVLLAAGISLWIARGERKAAQRARVADAGVALIRALGEIARTAVDESPSDLLAAQRQWIQDINAFAALLPGGDIPVAKFISVIVARANGRPGHDQARIMIWLITALELWLRGDRRTKEFVDNMPIDTTSWASTIDLGQWDAVLRGAPVTGIPDSVV